MLPHFHRKIFVKASEAFEKEEKKRQNEVIKHKKIKGAEAKAFYERDVNIMSKLTRGEIFKVPLTQCGKTRNSL